MRKANISAHTDADTRFYVKLARPATSGRSPYYVLSIDQGIGEGVLSIFLSSENFERLAAVIERARIDPDVVNVP